MSCHSSYISTDLFSVGPLNIPITISLKAGYDYQLVHLSSSYFLNLHWGPHCASVFHVSSYLLTRQISVENMYEPKVCLCLSLCQTHKVCLLPIITNDAQSSDFLTRFLQTSIFMTSFTSLMEILATPWALEGPTFLVLHGWRPSDAFPSKFIDFGWDSNQILSLGHILMEDGFLKMRLKVVALVILILQVYGTGLKVYQRHTL